MPETVFALLQVSVSSKYFGAGALKFLFKFKQAFIYAMAGSNEPFSFHIYSNKEIPSDSTEYTNSCSNMRYIVSTCPHAHTTHQSNNAIHTNILCFWGVHLLQFAWKHWFSQIIILLHTMVSKESTFNTELYLIQTQKLYIVLKSEHTTVEWSGSKGTNTHR